MRAKHKSGFVYTTRGHDPEMERLRDSAALTVAPSTPRVATLADHYVCPHGGQYFKGIPMCGACLHDSSGKYSESDKALAFAKHLDDICTMVAFKEHHRYFKAIPVNDRKSICFTAIWKNLVQIFKANKNPFGMAYTIADRALTAEERKLCYWREWRVDDMNFSKTKADDDQPLSEDEKLSYLKQEVDEGFEDESVRIFPDAKLLWTRGSIDKLMSLADEAMSKLPSWPFSHAEAIRLRSGFTGGREIPWPALAKHFDDTRYGRPVTERQIRYAVQNGLLEIRIHILRRLTPDLGEITKS
jgi:hypothetical protein